MNSRWAVGVDVGGTRLSVGLVSEHGELDLLQRESTPRNLGASVTLQRLRVLISAVLAGAAERAVVGIGVGFGGPVDHARQRIRWSHHAPGWTDISLPDLLGDWFRLPACVENDANAGGLAEALFGAGRGHGDVLYVNIGTGVGAALILGGHIHHGAHGNAGELGHMVLDPNGPPCPCGKRGCVEALCSGDAIGRLARERGGQWLSGREVGERARRGDELALTVVRDAATTMGLALAAAANLLDPGVIVLGGGVAELGEVYLGPVREAFAQHAMHIVAHTPILPAELGYDAGVIGAGQLGLFSQIPLQGSGPTAPQIP